MTLAAGVVVAAAGCGSSEKALKLPAVRASLRAAGVGKLHVLTQHGAYVELRKNGFSTELRGPADGPDYLQDPVAPALMVVRFGTVDAARHALLKTRLERRGRLAVREARICNVVIANFAPLNADTQSRSDQVMEELRNRCST
jgi:hypothetical protein